MLSLTRICVVGNTFASHLGGLKNLLEPKDTSICTDNMYKCALIEKSFLETQKLDWLNRLMMSLASSSTSGLHWERKDHDIRQRKVQLPSCNE